MKNRQSFTVFQLPFCQEFHDALSSMLEINVAIRPGGGTGPFEMISQKPAQQQIAAIQACLSWEFYDLKRFGQDMSEIGAPAPEIPLIGFPLPQHGAWPTNRCRTLVFL
ncbi:MAG: hypothetical protein IJH79_04215, partial [Lentisphaeria bacterium]|nr:hypothetical protein [Lentisphaeria bacterium]